MSGYQSKLKGAEVEALLPKMVNVTWEELVALRDGGKLIAGMKYRMTDYETMTSQDDTASAGHPFDLILTALDEKTLDEKCSAIHSARDTDGYFADSDLSAWELKYTIDNDTSRFQWAVTPIKTILVDAGGLAENIGQTTISGKYNGTFDYIDTTYHRWDSVILGLECYILTASESPSEGDTYKLYVVANGSSMDVATVISTSETTSVGKGVIYRMVDESQNECPYDFKNILYTRKLTNGVLDKESGVETLVYTFDSYNEDGSHSDDSKYCSNNRIGYSKVLCNNVFLNKGRTYCAYNTFGESCAYNTFGTGCYNNTFGESCYHNTFGESCYDNTFGRYCESNTFGHDCADNTFGDLCRFNAFWKYCYNNTFGDFCSSNTFGGSCRSNTFGEHCSSNTFGGSCRSNTFGEHCSSNTFGGSCRDSTFGYNCTDNTFGYNCYYTTFGNDCARNTFGGYCASSTFGDSCTDNTFGEEGDYNYAQTITLKSYCQYLKLTNSETASSNNLIQNYTISCISGTSSTPVEIAVKRNRAYETFVTKNKAGEIVEYTADDIINA